MKLPYFKNDPWLTTKIILEDMKKNSPEENRQLHEWFSKSGLKEQKDFKSFFDKITGRDINKDVIGARKKKERDGMSR